MTIYMRNFPGFEIRSNKFFFNKLNFFTFISNVKLQIRGKMRQQNNI